MTANGCVSPTGTTDALDTPAEWTGRVTDVRDGRCVLDTPCPAGFGADIGSAVVHALVERPGKAVTGFPVLHMDENSVRLAEGRDLTGATLRIPFVRYVENNA